MNILIFKRIKLILNKLNIIKTSIGLDDKLNYKPGNNTIYIDKSKSVKESCDILDSKINELTNKINQLTD